jgi:hypothetical protein
VSELPNSTWPAKLACRQNEIMDTHLSDKIMDTHRNLDTHCLILSDKIMDTHLI